MVRLVQLRHQDHGRCVARVEDSVLAVLDDFASAYDLVQAAIERKAGLEQFISTSALTGELNYDEIYDGHSDWTVLPPFDHPTEPARCRVTGTGLTHMRSAEARSSMHEAAGPGSSTEIEPAETDSLRMYRLGVEGGRRPSGEIGTAPEWFYKGDGWTVRAHGEALVIPSFACDGGEEAEIAGVYIIDADAQPRRVGFTIGNEFSDHEFERQNYLYLAHSKLRDCAIGPELVIGERFGYVPGEVHIERGSDVLWRKQIASGEERMSHSLPNLEHHHFKYEAHRRPGDVHIHFFGADALSSTDGIKLQDGDIVQVAFENFGRPLRNPIRYDRQTPKLVTVHPV